MEKTEELKAIESVATQVETFKTALKDKADSAEIGKLEKNLEALKNGLGTWSGEKVETKMNEINDQIAKFGKQIEELGEAVAIGKENASKGKKEDIVSTKDIQDFINATFKDGSKTHDKARIELKAAEIFGYSTFFTGISNSQTDAFTGRVVDPTLYQRKRKRNLILDHFPIMSVSAPKLYYLVKVEEGTGTPPNNASGSADWIASGGQKPQRSFRVGTGEVEAKKVAIFGTIEDKLLRDVASLENWVREDFIDELMEKYNDGLLNNDPGSDADAPLGLKINAITFAATPAFDDLVKLPNYIDAIIAAAAYMDDLKEVPAKAFVSGDVFYAMLALKASDGKYLNNPLVYTNSLGQLFIAGVEVVKSDSDDVPSTHLLMISADPGFKIRNYGPLVFERGLNGEDFRYDRTSYRGYQEVLSYIPENRENSVLYDTWDNIITDIELIEA